MSALQDETGRGALEWCARIQALIAKHSKPTADPNHDWTSSPEWVADLACELWTHLTLGDGVAQAGPVNVDENMWMAARLGEMLCCWYSAVQRAKIADPRRPIKERRRAESRYMEWLQELTAAVHQTRLLPDMFPGQAWENPFSPEATDGSFV